MSESSKTIDGAPGRRIVLWILFTIFILVLVVLLLEPVLHLIGKLFLPENRMKLMEAADADYVAACVGDSIALGIGASDPGYSYPARLEGILRQRHPGLNICIINEGVAGINSSELILRLERLLPRYSRPPNLLIVTAFHNNTWNLCACSALLEGYAKLPTSKRWVARLQTTKVGKLAVMLNFRGRKLARYLADVVSNDRHKWRDARDGSFVYLLNPSIPEERAFLEPWMTHDLTRIKAIAEASQIKLLVGLYPDSDINPLIRQIASDLSIPCCEKPETASSWNRLGLLSNDGWHPNDKGYAAFAENMADCIEEGNLMPRRNAAKGRDIEKKSLPLD